MRSTKLLLMSLFVCVVLWIPAAAQQRASDPVTGTWSGDWGPNTRDRNQVTVELKLSGKDITGTVKSTRPQRADVALQKSTFDPATGTIHLEADVQNPRSGQMVRFIADGKVENNTMSGSWNHGETKGDFKLTKN